MHHEVEEAGIDVHRLAVPVKAVFAGGTCLGAPLLVHGIDRPLDLIASNKAKVGQVADGGRRDHTDIGFDFVLMVREIAKRLQGDELVQVLEVLTSAFLSLSLRLCIAVSVWNRVSGPGEMLCVS